MSKMQELRAAYWSDKGQGREMREVSPNGRGRSQPFKTELRTSEAIQQNGTEKRRIEGYASIVNRGYPMWDMFGEYEEVVMPGAFDRTLSRNPDVAFLVNHRGVTMARTSNGTLELAADDTGLWSGAYVNPKRSDVNDLLVGIDDKDITEMSFAFMIDSGEWSEEFDKFRIHEVELHRGDVSAVNYGANPYTSVAARQQEIIRDFGQIPRGAQAEAMRAAGFEREAQSEEKRVCPDCAHAELTESRDEKALQVDSGITDPHTLWIEQWLHTEMLGK